MLLPRAHIFLVSRPLELAFGPPEPLLKGPPLLLPLRLTGLGGVLEGAAPPLRFLFSGERLLLRGMLGTLLAQVRLVPRRPLLHVLQ